LAAAFDNGGCPLRLRLRLIADRLEAGDAVLERRVVEIGHAAFDRIIEPLEP